MSKIITQDTNIREEFFIEENPKLSGHKIDSVTLLQNGPVSTGYDTREIVLGSGNTMNFQVEMSETTFLDSCVAIDVKLPVTLTTGTALTASANNYQRVEWFKDVAIKQYGLLNAIDNIKVVVNGSLNLSIGDVYRKFAAVASFYDSETALKKLPYSLPDSYTDYTYYQTTGSGDFPSVDLNGQAIELMRPVSYPLNVFDSTNSYEYNSRRPVLTIDSIAANSLSVNCTLRLRTYIPFSLFSLPDAEATSLYGITSLSLSIMMVPDYVKHLFSFRGTKWTSATLGPGNSASAKMCFKTMSPASYVAKSITDNGVIKPYRINLSKIQEGVPVQKKAIAALGSSGEVNGQLNMGTVPDKLYIYAVPDKYGANIEKTPTFFGRPETLSVQIGSSLTTITGAERLYALSVENGLRTTYDVAMFTAGFPICLDLSKDLGLGADVLLNMNMQTNIQVKLTFTSLSNAVTDYIVCFDSSQTSQLVYENRKFTEYNSIITNSMDFGADNIITHLYNTYHLTTSIPIMGGSIFSSLFKGLKNIGRYVINNPGKVAKFAQDAYKTITGSGGRGSNVIGGKSAESRTLLLGSGSTKTDSIFK